MYKTILDRAVSEAIYKYKQTGNDYAVIAGEGVSKRSPYYPYMVSEYKVAQKVFPLAIVIYVTDEG